MKNLMKVYFKLRKSWLIGLYALIIVAGLTSMANDSVQWHRWEKIVVQSTSKAAYQKTRTYLKTHPKADIYAQDFPNDYQRYLETIRMIKPLPINNNEPISAKMIYQFAPLTYDALKTDLLSYYSEDKRTYRSDPYFSTAVLRYIPSVGENGQHTEQVSINKIGLMGLNICLAFAALYGILLIVDQLTKVTAFIKGRTGEVNRLNLVQFIYWAGIPLVMITFLSVITHLTRSLFIPSQYVAIPWEDLLVQGGNSLSISLGMVLLISFVNVLVGKPIYKLLTLFLGVPACLLAGSNIVSLLNMPSLNAFLKSIAYPVYFLILLVILLPIIMILHKHYSLEQDTFYIKLDKLRLPFYSGILVLVILDFVLTFFLPNRFISTPLDIGLLIGLIVGIPIIFAKLVLNKDIRRLVIK
ncbi:hypothetical protein RU86_GL001901 [Lactococcus piscium]|uniref:Uncharacterized protein n=1 Tax=Pseudolactococcus piscium TaxID=1364 RepID=A0A2A5S2Z6_9LACT|nr:hypothetical protein [Lactococcus piscium]PCS07844.1 hypothetical protein RU86_GL001901 [Lactococcus piscium]